jgi:hypothetical protein
MKQYARLKDAKKYKEELDQIFNIDCNPEMVRIYIEEMGWDFLTAEIDRLNYIKKELCQTKSSKGNGRINPLDEQYMEDDNEYKEPKKERKQTKR